MPTPAKPIAIDGINYPSQSEAARTFNIPIRTLVRKIKKDQNLKEVSPQPLSKPVLTPFGEFRSLHQVWKHTGLTPKVIKCRIKNKIEGYKYL